MTDALAILVEEAMRGNVMVAKGVRRMNPNLWRRINFLWVTQRGGQKDGEASTATVGMSGP